MEKVLSGIRSYRQAVLHCPQSLGSVPFSSIKIDFGLFGSGARSACGPRPAVVYCTDPTPAVPGRMVVVAERSAAP